jgi:hypothetical protein
VSASTTAVLVGGGTLADGIAAALDVPLERLAPARLDDAHELLGDRVSERGLVWIHLVPSAAGDEPTDEAALLVRSAHAARGLAEDAGAPVTFIAVLPMPGMFRGAAALACDLALSAMTSLMRVEIGDWSSDGRRIAGVVHAGIEGYEPAGQRPLEEIRLRTPMASLAGFQQVADALRFVGSRSATYITGTLVRVDGGCDGYSWVYPARTI